MERLMTLREVAEVLRISADSCRWIPVAELPRFRVGPHGGSLRYCREDVDAFIHSRREGDAPKVVRCRAGRRDGKPFQHL